MTTDTFLPRSLQRMAIGTHVRFYEHGPKQVGIVISRAQMGVVGKFIGYTYVRLSCPQYTFKRAMGVNIHYVRTSYLYVLNGSKCSTFPVIRRFTAAPAALIHCVLSSSFRRLCRSRCGNQRSFQTRSTHYGCRT